MLRLLRVRVSLTGAFAVAAPVSFGAVYLIALLATRLALSVQACCLTAVGGLLAYWAWDEISRRRQSGKNREWGSSRGLHDIWLRRLRQADEQQVIGGLLLAVAVVVGPVLWTGLHSALTVPAGWDAMHHGYFVRQIVDHDTLAPAIVLSSDPGTADGTTGFYPLAFDLATALLHQISGVPISVLMLAGTTALAGVLLPCSTYYLVRVVWAGPGSALPAGFASIATLLPINLYTIEYTGRITAVLGLAIVPAGCALILQAGLRPTSRFWAISVLTIIGVTGMHTSEVPLLFAVVMLFAVVRASLSTSWLHLVRSTCVLAGSALLAGSVLVAIEPGVLRLIGERSAVLGSDNGHQNLPDAVRALLTQPQFHHGGMAFFACAAVLGSLLTVHPRLARLRGAALCYLGFAGFYLAWVTGSLGPLSFLGLPWYRDPARMMWVLSLLGAIPVGVALTVLAASTRRGLALAVRRWDTGHQVAQRLPRLVAAASVMALVFAVATPAVRTESMDLLKPASPVTPDYQAAFRYLAAHSRPGQRVLDDLRNHGDMWMFVDDDVPTLLGNAPLIGRAPKSWDERLYLRGNLARIGTDPCIGRLLTTYQVSYVFYGDQVLDAGSPRISLSTLRNTRQFREVFRRGGAHVFLIIAPEAAGRCSRDVTTEFPWSSIADAN